jgi:hypothetical protein
MREGTFYSVRNAATGTVMQKLRRVVRQMSPMFRWNVLPPSSGHQYLTLPPERIVSSDRL